MRYLELTRRAKGLTQSDVGRRAGVSRDLVGEVERGRTNPTTDELAQIAKALGVEPPERLLTHVVDPFSDELPVA